MLPDRSQEFQDYALAMAQLKGVPLEQLAERLDMPLDVLSRRSQTREFSAVRERVLRSTGAAALCRVKINERAVELVETMIGIALGEVKGRPSQTRMLIALRDVLLPSALQQSMTHLADTTARTQQTISASMSTHIAKLQELSPPKRTIDTPILRGKEALPRASRLSLRDDSD